MKIIKEISKLTFLVATVALSSCSDLLTDANKNPNVVDPENANYNLVMPPVLATTAMKYLDLGWGDMSGTMQHTQHDGWFGGYNHYEWGPTNWNEYYDRLRDNALLMKSPNKFHQGIALTMRAFLYGNITDFWGDAPYTESLKGDQGIVAPVFDNQEVIYKGVIEDLKAAAAIFATGDNSGYLANYDSFYNGDPAKWHKFANSLLLRYYLRVSTKLPDLAKAGIEAVYASGVYIKTPAEDASVSFVGTVASNNWPYIYYLDAAGESNFRRKKPAQTLVSQFKATSDPRLKVWFAPVHVQWVADPTLTVATEPYIRKNGVIQEGVGYLEDKTLKAGVAAGNKYTRHFNPTLYAAANAGATLDTSLYVGVPAGLRQPDFYNGNPTPGQTVENQHVSQLSDIYRYSNKASILKARIITSSEVEFILAESALKGYGVGSAETHYKDAIKRSLETWDVASSYDAFIAKAGVAYAGTLEQIITQKWIASWSASSEAWMDYRRTGFPNLKAGQASAQPVLPVRFIYGDSEVNNNRTNSENAISGLEQNSYSTANKNSQWAKPWLLKGTGKPW